MTETDIRSDLDVLTGLFTREDLLHLGVVTDEFYGNQEQSYFNLMRDEVITDAEGAPIKSIMQFLGSYVLSISEIEALKSMGPFIFDEPLEEMPLYVNEHDGVLPWKTIVARWRLAIGK